jgi:hypothetical protein
MASLISFLFGCNGGDSAYPIQMAVLIDYVDREGNVIIMEGADSADSLAAPKPLEILSITNENGIPVEFGAGRDPIRRNGSYLGIEILEDFYTDSPEMDHQYSIKYKLPSLGESVEEIKLIFHTDGWSSEFTHAWYNNKEILRHITNKDLYPNYYRPDKTLSADDWKEFERREKELMYNGKDMVAYISGFDITLVLPVDTVQ